MKIYLASGYSVMNVKGRERELMERIGRNYRSWNRLISFYDLERGNDIFAVINLVKENENLLCKC